MKKTLLLITALFALLLTLGSCATTEKIPSENRAAFDELQATFAAAKPLVENETDRLVLTAAMNNLVMLSETSPLRIQRVRRKIRNKGHARIFQPLGAVRQGNVQRRVRSFRQSGVLP